MQILTSWTCPSKTILIDLYVLPQGIELGIIRLFIWLITHTVQCIKKLLEIIGEIHNTLLLSNDDSCNVDIFSIRENTVNFLNVFGSLQVVVQVFVVESRMSCASDETNILGNGVASDAVCHKQLNKSLFRHSDSPLSYYL